MTSETILRERREIDAAIAGTTILDLFDRNASNHGDRPAIHWREGDEWKSLTWGEYHRQVAQVAAGLVALGIEPGDFVAIQAGNRPEHVIADLAAVTAGGTPVTFYSTLASGQIAYIASNCEAKVAILENLEFMKRWEEIRQSLPHLRYVVLMEGAENYPTEDWVLSWDELAERGEESTGSDEMRTRRSTITPESVATLIYTSGTTGVPKGVIITHRNVLWTAESVRRAFEPPESPRFVSYLPLAHIAERSATHYSGIYLAGEVWYCPDLTQVLDYVQAARPQIFFGVPRVWEKFHSRLLARFDENEKRDLIYKALGAAIERVEAEQAGRRVGLVDRVKGALFDRLVFSKVRSQLGMDQVQLAITAAAPINPDLIVFFNAIGIPLLELYGMSENTGPAVSNRPDDNRIGTVGKPLPGVELRLEEDGEILLRGGLVVPGYYKLPEETAETFDADGWLHTGDIGALDEDGYLKIVGRKKEIIITAAGKNVAPTVVETLIKDHPLISQVCVIGDGRKYLTAVISLDPEEAPLWAAAHGVPFEDLESFSTRPEVVAAVQEAVDRANQAVSRVEQVKKFYIAPDAWTPESGEVTPSLKLKRRVVLERYADQIEAMYAETAD
jgi:long-chain acyl-CoA synthetase